MLINKTIIKNNFSRASKNYDEFAVVQNLVAKKLCELVCHYLKHASTRHPWIGDPRILGAELKRSSTLCVKDDGAGGVDDLKIVDFKILDLGSGSGFVAKNILSQNKNCQIFEIDLVRPVIKNPATSFIQCDMEKLCFKPDSFDLITSSFALQWAEDLEKTFAKFYKILKPNGIFIFAIPLDESLLELKNASIESGCDFHFNQLPKRENLEKIIEKSDFNLLNLYQETIKQPFASGIDAIKSIKKIGANYSWPRKNKIKKIQLKKFDNCLKNASNARAYEISWLVNYFILSK